MAITVSMGASVPSKNDSARATVGHVRIEQVGRTVHTLTIEPGKPVEATLRPGLYQFVVTNIDGCRAGGVVLWQQTRRIRIGCSVK